MFNKLSFVANSRENSHMSKNIVLQMLPLTPFSMKIRWMSVRMKKYKSIARTYAESRQLRERNKNIAFFYHQKVKFKKIGHLLYNRENLIVQFLFGIHIYFIWLIFEQRFLSQQLFKHVPYVKIMLLIRLFNLLYRSRRKKKDIFTDKENSSILKKS